MAFNKNASKRLSILAGIERESREVTDIVNSIVQTFLTAIIKRAIHIIEYTGRKTLITDDIRFLSKICDEYPNIACADNISKMTKVCIDIADLHTVLNGEKGYAVYTLKKPFNNLVRNIANQCSNEEIRIGKNVVILLQNLTEHYIITIMNRASTYTIRDNRDTLLPEDIETALKTLYT